MSGQATLLAHRLDAAWRSACGRLDSPALLVVSCEDAARVRRELGAWRAAAAPATDLHPLAVPPRRELRPLEPLLGWWQGQGSADERQRVVSSALRYAPMRTMLSALAAGRPPQRDETPLLDEVDFERTSLLPEAVARRTLQAIRRNEALASIGREAVMARTLKRWAPSLLERVLRG